ncbi:MAG: hypothetical protein AAB400_04590 [Patescibacteria group bacterium]
MLKREKILTKTISLPVTVARRVERVARRNSTTISDLFRESFRLYEREQANEHQAGKRTVEWKKLRDALGRMAKKGKRIKLSTFIINDRQAR